MHSTICAFQLIVQNLCCSSLRNLTRLQSRLVSFTCEILISKEVINYLNPFKSQSLSLLWSYIHTRTYNQKQPTRDNPEKGVLRGCCSWKNQCVLGNFGNFRSWKNRCVLGDFAPPGKFDVF